MSNIPKARRLLERVLESTYLEAPDSELVEEALSHMTRQGAQRKAPTKNRGITSGQWDTVMYLSRTTSMSQQEIATHVGLNSGRVSEIINKKRKRPE